MPDLDRQDYVILNSTVNVPKAIDVLYPYERIHCMLDKMCIRDRSTIINKLIPGVNLRTGDISEYHNKGMHTTTFSEMIPLSDGGYLIGTYSYYIR